MKKSSNNPHNKDEADSFLLQISHDWTYKLALTELLQGEWCREFGRE